MAASPSVVPRGRDDLDPDLLRALLHTHRRARADQLDALDRTVAAGNQLDEPTRARLLVAARTMLTEIDAALERLDDGTYGWCLGCLAAIDTERLLEAPYTRYCSKCATRSDPDRSHRDGGRPGLLG